MQALPEIHMKAAKCLLRYLKWTLDHGLHLSRTNRCLSYLYEAQCHLLVL